MQQAYLLRPTQSHVSGFFEAILHPLVVYLAYYMESPINDPILLNHNRSLAGKEESFHELRTDADFLNIWQQESLRRHHATFQTQHQLRESRKERTKHLLTYTNDILELF